MGVRRCLLAVAMVAASLLIVVAPAAAAPPSNDDITAAVPVRNLPFTDSRSTVDATTAPDDPACVGNGHSVWYRIPVGRDMLIEAKTTGSNYDTTMSAYTGSPGNLTLIACNDDFGSLQSRIEFLARRGQTIFLLVGSFPETPGGNLVLSIRQSGSVPPSTPGRPLRLITFTELPTQPVDDVSIAGVTFDYKVGGVDSTDATYNSIGPGDLTYVQDPSVEGGTGGVLTLDFRRPTRFLRFGLGLLTTDPARPGFTVQVFTPGFRHPRSFTVNTRPTVSFSEAVFIYEGRPIRRAVVRFNAAAASRFALDNLLFIGHR